MSEPRKVKCGHKAWGGTLGTSHCITEGCYNSIQKCKNHKHLWEREQADG